MKKSLFNKPKWAAQAVSPTEAPAKETRSFFQHDVYEDIIHAQRKKEERRKERQKEKEDQARRKSDSRNTKVDTDEKAVKKQRLSDEPVLVDLEEEEDDFERKSDSESEVEKTIQGKQSSRKKSRTPDREADHPTTRSTPKKDRRRQDDDYESIAKSGKERVTVYSDDDLAIIDVQPAIKPKTKPKPPPPPAEPESDDDEEDEYIKALKQQAREQVKAQISQPINKSSSRATATPTPGPEAKPPTATNTATDPEIHLRIKTIIPSCDDTYVKRLASQTLESVLQYFTSHHKIGPQLASQIFFTWNDQKLYSSTTMRSILSQIRAKYGTKPDGSDLSEGMIEIEAVTEEIWKHRLDQRKREKERKEREANGERINGEQGQSDGAFLANSSLAPAQAHPQPQGQSEGQGQAQVHPTKGPGLILHLKPAPDSQLTEMSLRVYADTTIERIVRGYKSKQKLDPNMNLYLVFDGDALETDQTVGDVGFENGDAVDLRIRGSQKT